MYKRQVIDSDGSQLGIMSSKDALKLALSKNLDLVKIAPQAVPPVCRIMDYGKYRFCLLYTSRALAAGATFSTWRPTAATRTFPGV